MLYLEIGNSTCKLAERKPDGTFRTERFDDSPSLLSAIPIGAELLLAPVAEAKASALLPQLAERGTIHRLDRSDFADFVAGSYDTPETLGLDRILHLYALETDAVVISCGTGITVDALRDGRPYWGAILSGFRTASEGLSAHAPALPVISSEDPPQLPARTTQDSLANGLITGTTLAIQGLADLLAGAIGLEDAAPAIITGGEAEILAGLWRSQRSLEIRPDLLFAGMARKGESTGSESSAR